MAIEVSQIKFAKSEESGELIGFVSRHSKTKKLKGVREDSGYGKKICVLSENLKGTLLQNVLYNVELKEMHNKNGFVVVSAIPVKFKARVETLIVSKKTYQVHVIFGNKKIYFDPIEGKSNLSRTIAGVIEVLSIRHDIDNPELIIEILKKEAKNLLETMKKDGYDIC